MRTYEATGIEYETKTVIGQWHTSLKVSNIGIEKSSFTSLVTLGTLVEDLQAELSFSLLFWETKDCVKLEEHCYIVTLTGFLLNTDLWTWLLTIDQTVPFGKNIYLTISVELDLFAF